MTQRAGWLRLAALLGAFAVAGSAVTPAVLAAGLAPGATAGRPAAIQAAAAGQAPFVAAAVVVPGRGPVAREVADGTLEPVSPAAQGTPAAVDGLDVATAATYVLDPAAREVRVGVDITAVNRMTDTAGLRYYYPGVNLAVQPEASSITADQGGASDRTTTEPRTGYRLLAVQFHASLYEGEAAHVHLDYTLPAGAPRSASGVRVGAAYSTFVVWSFGDRGTVEVDAPSAFDVTTSGATLAESVGEGGQHVLAATVADPGSWYAWINARNDAALTTTTLELPGNEQVVVRAWPEDPTWRRRVAQVLTTGIPVLLSKVGLPWPVSGRLTVLEVSAALLEGYAGFNSASAHEITVSENLDPLTIIHEASHAWFNESLFADRWITEGLANEYAYRTLKAIGVSASGPADVRTTAAVAFPLDTWGSPAPIKTRTQDAHEQWAYDAAWTVIREVVTKVGEPGMSKVFAAAAAGTTAYVGTGTFEKAALPADWRRFVDLAEEVGGGTGVAEMIAPWVLTPAQRGELAQRAAARSAYHAVVSAGGGWAAPIVVRMDLDRWDFGAAGGGIAAASSVLGARDAIRRLAAAEGLAVPSSLQTAYEAAATVSALARAADDEARLREALDAVAAADAAAAAPRDGPVALGLLGADPAATLAAARSAWEAGDVTTATQDASAVAGQLAVAADAGRLRMVAIAAALLALALLAAVVRRRASHGRQTADASAEASAAPGASDPYPILPASATAEVPLEPPSAAEDEGAE